MTCELGFERDMAIVIANQENKALNQNKKGDFFTFVVFGTFALTLTVVGILTLIFYVQFLNNRTVDLRELSEHFHKNIEEIMSECHLRYEPLNSTHTINVGQKIFTYCEYLIRLSDEESLERVIDTIKPLIFKIGLSPKSNKRIDSNPYISVYYDKLEIARIYFDSPEEKKLPDYYQLLKNIVIDTKQFFEKNLPNSEIIESLAEFNSDPEANWAHKTITVINSGFVFDNLVSNYKSSVLAKYPSTDLSAKSETIEVFYNFRKILTIILTNNVFDRGQVNTACLSVRVPEFYLYYPDKKVTLQNRTNNEDICNSILFSALGESQYFGFDDFFPKIDYLREEDEQDYMQPSVNIPPRVVIILDDGGYRNPEYEQALELPSGVIFSIIPDAYYAQQLAEMAHIKGFQLMIHLPMQNKPGTTKPTYSTELLINMSEEEIRERIAKACEIIPYAKGINNHTGSVYSLKAEPLRLLAKVLKEKGLFFVDSVVVSKSIAYDVMKEEGVTTYKRDVFLDHDYSYSEIRNRVNELKSIAKKKGIAIGIGHFRELTIQVLMKEIPNFEKEGIKLVNLEENYKLCMF